MHNLEIDQQNLAEKVPFARREFNRLVKQVVAVFPVSISRIHLSLSFVDNKIIKEINNRYRGKNKVTDVLSFASPKDFIGWDAAGEIDLGEIIICYPRAVEQAKTYRESIQEEINRLVVHGILHLLGFDHEISAKADQEMMELQEKILSSLK